MILLADFGDFNHFPSQDFLREYVLFPVVSPEISKISEIQSACDWLGVNMRPEGTHSPGAYLQKERVDMWPLSPLLFPSRTGLTEMKCWRIGRKKLQKSTKVTGTPSLNVYSAQKKPLQVEQEMKEWLLALFYLVVECKQLKQSCCTSRR